ncbi:putative tail structural protein [Roseobacter phage CRP-6]|nr:putative tail structural protein [Roseobacter phage CRP-6]
MAFAQGSRSSLSYIVESTFGTTPAGNFQNLPFTTHSLNMTKDRVSGTDINADRMSRVDRHGNRTVAGDITADLRDTDYDDFLEAAMLNTWNANVLKVGTVPKYFSIEDYAADIDQARLFTGCSVNTLSVALAPNAMVTGTFGIVGKDMVVSATEKTQDAATGASPFDAYSGDLEIGGSVAAIVTAMDFTVTNGFAPTFVVGDDSAPSLEVGDAVVEGSISAYFEDASLLNRFIDETETSLKVTVGDNESTPNTMEFFFPRCKINSADVGVDGPTSRVIALSFVALRDETEATNLRITRT